MHGLERLLDLSPSECERLQHVVATSEKVPARRKLIDESKPSGSAFLVAKGWLIEYKLLRTGQRQILNFRLPGEITGLDGLANPVAGYSVATLTECSVIPLQLDALNEMQRSCAKLASGLLLLILRERAILHQWELRLGRTSAYDRVAHLLLELHHRLQRSGLAIGPPPQFPATQTEIADSVGLTTPYVNRMLQVMRDKGLIRLGPRLLEIRDPAGLAHEVGFNADYLAYGGPAARG